MDYNVTYREKDKGWQCIISYKTDDGWKQKSKQGFKTQKASKDWIKDTVKSLEAKVNLNKEYDGITYDEYKEIFIERVKRYKAPKTVINYDTVFKHFEQLKDKKMEDIKRIHIQNCVDKMTDEGLESSTVKEYVTKIKTFFNVAVEEYEIIEVSPVKKINIVEKKNNRERNALSYSQFVKLITKVKNLKHKAVIVVAGACGLRAGELLGLTWDCVNFSAGEIKVAKQWKENKDGKMEFGELKTKNSYREVPMSEDVIKILKDYKKKYPTDIHNRVFLYASTNSLTSYISKVLNKYDCNNTTLHELRHTFATTLIANGVDFKTVAKLMGHDVEQTIKTYSHVTDDMLQNGIKIVNDSFIF